MRKKMMKNRSSIVLCSVMLAAAMLMGGCGKEAEEVVAETETTAEITTETSAETTTETTVEKETETMSETESVVQSETEDILEETEQATETDSEAAEKTEVKELPETKESAESKKSKTVDEPASTPAPVMSSIRVYGAVQEMSDGKLFIKNDNPNDMYGQIILNVTEETKILDAVNAETKTIADIETGEVLYAYVSPVMTRSMPPMSNAELILCDIPADIAVPEYAEIVSVTAEADGRISLLTNRDMIYWVGAGADTEILDFTTREPIDVSSIKEGSRVLAWYQIVLQSFPGQTTPNKILVF